MPGFWNGQLAVVACIVDSLPSYLLITSYNQKGVNYKYTSILGHGKHCHAVLRLRRLQH